MTGRASRHPSGFTLLEVLIAFVIAGIAITAMVRVGSQSMHATSVAMHYQEAVSRARSRLDLLSATLVPGEQSGDDGGGFQWRTLVRQVDASRELAIGLYAMSVVVTWHDGEHERAVRLESKRVHMLPPA